MVSLGNNFDVKITEGYIDEPKSLYQRHKLDMPIHKYSSSGIYICSVSPLSFGFPAGKISSKIFRQLNRPYLSCKINDFYYSFRKLDSKLTEEELNRYGKIDSWILDKIDYNNMYHYHHSECIGLPNNMNKIIVSSPDELPEYCCVLCAKRSDTNKIVYSEHWIKKILSFGYEIIETQPKLIYKCPICNSVYTFDKCVQECPTCVVNSLESKCNDIPKIEDIIINIDTNDIHVKEELKRLYTIIDKYKLAVKIQQNTFRDITRYMGKNSSCFKSTNHIMHIFSGMNQRCYNTNSSAYSSYGGKGIFICKYWRDDPVRFVIWCLENGNKNINNPSIDRIDPRYEYAPYNCQIIDCNYNRKKKNIDNKRSVSTLKIDEYIFNRRKKNWIKQMVKNGYKEEDLI